VIDDFTRSRWCLVLTLVSGAANLVAAILMPSRIASIILAVSGTLGFVVSAMWIAAHQVEKVYERDQIIADLEEQFRYD